jgi:hypothetical protein
MGPYPSYLVDGTANPFGNKIIVGGLMLLPPFFDANADAAANYGGLGLSLPTRLLTFSIRSVVNLMGMVR